MRMPLASVFCWGCADVSFEVLAEVALVVESGGDRNFRNQLSFRQ